jgi:hypothetical protein
MYYGVPLEKIDESHPYWDAEWLPLEGIIGPQLDGWHEKLSELRQNKEAVRHTVFLANRQVNRGQTVMDFLNNPERDFHPYQYVGKELMGKIYKTFVNYDTMFRLVNVHEELKKFELDVTPLEWLRQRMYEVSLAHGDKFSLSKYTHDLYHDAKLKQLREKHGFGNIGRPSGYKVGEKNPDKGKAKLKREQLAGKASGGSRRKNRRSIGQVDADGMEDGSPAAANNLMAAYQRNQAGAEEYLEPVTPRLQKRQRLEAAPTQSTPQVHIKHEPEPEPQVDDLQFDGYTSTDSFSAGRIHHLDFRIGQIKTPQLTTSAEVTQYLTFRGEKSAFEHQVLRDVHPKVTWGFYQKTVNLDLKLDEIRSISYAPECQKIVVLVKENTRTDMVVYFKRERTMKRFLHFVRKKGVPLVKGTP